MDQECIDNIEKVAQLKYENKKLQNEKMHLLQRALSLEESYNSLIVISTEKDNHIKSLQQQNSSFHDSLNEKISTIESLEEANENLQKLIKKLMVDQCTLKKELAQEQDESVALKRKEEENRILLTEVKEENKKLLNEYSIKCKEYLLSDSTVKDLLMKVKVLETEKLELMALKDSLIHQLNEEKMKRLEEVENIVAMNQYWVLNQPKTHGREATQSGSHQSLSLLEEMLEVEVHEKKNIIEQLRQKENDYFQLCDMIKQLKINLLKAGLLTSKGRTDIDLSCPSLIRIQKHLIKLISWPECQSGELNEISDVNDGIEMCQPQTLRVVETFSIASQTDPIANLSPVLPLKCYEVQKAKDTGSPLDPSEDFHCLSHLQKFRLELGAKTFLNHKNFDLDMDIFRFEVFNNLANGNTSKLVTEYSIKGLSTSSITCDSTEKSIEVWSQIGDEDIKMIEYGKGDKSNTLIQKLVKKIKKTVAEWTKCLTIVTRFRCSNYSLQYIHFYSIRSLVLAFTSILYVGITLRLSQYINCPHLHYAVWIGIITFSITIRRFSSVFILCVFALNFFAILIFYLVKILFVDLTSEEMYQLLNTLGLKMEIRYLNGPPPV